MIDEGPRADSSQPASLANLRHTLRTPLNHIIGYSEMLLEEAEERNLEGFVTDLHKIHMAGKQLLALIDNILDPATTQAGSPPPTPKTPGPSALFRDEARGSRPEAADRTPPLQPLSGRLLVVDDNESNRDMLSRRLKHEGYDVCMAESGRQALELVKTQPVDLVLLDVMMPEMNGYEVLQHLKAHSTWRDIPVIMISALDEIESVVRCIEMGAEDYLPKPFDPALLRARIGACLEKKRLRDQEVWLFEEVRKRTTDLANVNAELERDITERKRAEEALLATNAELHETRHYLTRLIESSTDAIISTDKGGTLVLFNKGAVAMLGYRAEEMIGRRVTVLYESEERAKEVMRQMRKQGGTVSAFETVLRAKDGSSIPVLISASTLYDEDGQEAGTVGFNKDLRPLKQAEEELRRAKAQIQALRIEIDQTKKARQVSEITDTEYFQDLQKKAKSLRDRPKMG